jgi:site-specific DNA-methyltransferase (cytosine-N4-specific)
MKEFNLDDLKVDFNNSKNNSNLTHNFHSYPAKFIPAIPRKAIEKLTKEGETIMDPFCGCGTTLVEAKILNRRSIGIDSNPLACLISKVKCTKINDFKLIKIFIKEIEKDINSLYNNQIDKEAIKIPTFFNVDHWFQKNVQNELSLIRERIEKVSDENIKDFLKVAFSAILVRISNQESDTRYAAIKKDIKDKEVLNVYIKKVESMISKLRMFNEISSEQESIVFNADTRNLNKIKENSIDLIVTSPPYANTYDYYLYHKSRMLWLGMDAKKTQETEFGSRNRHNDKKLGIEDYNENLEACFKEIKRVLKKGKYICIIIGDCIIRGEFIDIGPIVIDIGKRNDLDFLGEYKHSLKKYTRTFNPKFTNSSKFEHVMFFIKKSI